MQPPIHHGFYIVMSGPAAVAFLLALIALLGDIRKLYRKTATATTGFRMTFA
jgi:hypothetical protein